MFIRGLLAAGLSLGAVAPTSLWQSPTPKPVLTTIHPTVAPDVVQAANAFLATLSVEQRQQVGVGFNATNAAKWSNFPCGLSCRDGLLLQSLTPAQQAAALAVVRAATGTVANDGFDEIQQMRAADDQLAAVPAGQGWPPGGGLPPGQNGPPLGGAPPAGDLGGGGYGSAIYAIAFLGTPSTTGTWMLQFGGHHLATNITFSKGAVTGASPKFEGVEPLRFTTTNSAVLPKGTACAPMDNEAAVMLALLSSLSASQKSQAKLSQSFGDVLVGPGRDNQFPTQKAGLAGRALTANQRQLLLQAMKPWVQDSDDATAAHLLADYAAQLAGTYVAYSGTGNFTAEGDYVRLDGPGVWIELVCQRGVVFPKQLHYHSIWRDHTRDYGGNFSRTPTH